MEQITFECVSYEVQKNTLGFFWVRFPLLLVFAPSAHSRQMVWCKYVCVCV